MVTTLAVLFLFTFVNQLGVFQHDGGIGNEGQINCVVLCRDLSNCIEVTNMLRTIAIKVGLVGHIFVWNSRVVLWGTVWCLVDQWSAFALFCSQLPLSMLRAMLL